MKPLLFDLEITPTLGWTYGRYDTNVIRVEREPYIMCFSYKWLGESVKCVAQTDFKDYKKNPHDDLEVTKKLWELLNEAEIVIAHNAVGFDNKVANERFLVHRLGPPSPFKTIDTLQVARRYFKNGSNSLDNLCSKLELGSKSEDKHSNLWRDCIDGDTNAWKKMIRYCKNDTLLLEKLYKELTPYIKNHPNVANLTGKTEACPKCGSYEVQYRGYEHSSVATYHKIQCQSCGGWSRERMAEKVDKPYYVNC
jgi:DNA polymerase elongation subunit (family B)